MNHQSSLKPTAVEETQKIKIQSFGVSNHFPRVLQNTRFFLVVDAGALKHGASWIVFFPGQRTRELSIPSALRGFSIDSQIPIKSPLNHH
jgi:hypothetical protein